MVGNFRLGRQTMNQSLSPVFDLFPGIIPYINFCYQSAFR